tara:strand:- start:2125 stop:3057 length:933 start_codon:yes stop_codon:yes gene_type:complete
LKVEEFKKLAEKYTHKKVNSQERLAMDIFFSKMQEANKNVLVPISSEKREKLFYNIQQNLTIKRKRTPLKKYLAMAAAGFTTLLMLGFFTGMFSNNYTTIIAEKGEKKEIKMDDGSVIFLNGNSSITYENNFTEERTVKLQGEAFFKVARDTAHPFTIQSKDLETRVLGTSFNIKSYKDQVPMVSVNTGKVEVIPLKNPEYKVILTKDQQASFKENRKPKISKGDSRDFNAWTRKMIILKNTSLEHTAKIIENWYDVNIQFADDSLKQLKITGKFNDEKLSNVLKSLALIKNLKIDSTNKKQIIIRKNPI